MHNPEKQFRDLIVRHVDLRGRQEYCLRSCIQSVVTFCHIWAALAASFGVIVVIHEAALSAQCVVAPLLVVFIGSRLNALAVQVHEGAHGLLTENRTCNDWLCNFCGGWWVLNDSESYWQLHREHHSNLHESTDPDRDLYDLPPTRSGILHVLLEDLLWLTAARRVFQYWSDGGRLGKKAATSLVNLLGILAAQAAVLMLFVLVFGAVRGAGLWVAFWLVPLFSVFPLLIRIRIATEHYCQSLRSGPPFGFVSRTSVSNWLEEYLIGSQMEYHLEHHLFPNLPYYQLKRLHRRLAQAGAFESLGIDQTRALSGGYLRFWCSLLAARPQNQREESAVA